MPLTLNQLRVIMPHARQRADQFIDLINAAMAEFEINTPLRMAAFIAQLAHESGELRYLQEIASGSAYEGREDLGNTQPGDGQRFKGRGLMQITGRENYRKCGQYFGVDFEADPWRLSRPEWAARAAGWFWHIHKNLNPLADAQEFKRITKRINGGYNHLAQRIEYYERAKRAIKTPPAEPDPALTLEDSKMPLLPFVKAALPALLDAAPDLIRIFGDGEQTEKNAKAAEKVVEVAKVVTGEETAEAAVTKIQADPVMAEAFAAEARAQFLEIEALVDRRVQAAREHNKNEPLIIDTKMLKMKFVQLLGLLVAVAALVGIGWILVTSTDKAERTLALQTLFLTGFAGVMLYNMGSSSGSDKKTDSMMVRKDG